MTDSQSHTSDTAPSNDEALLRQWRTTWQPDDLAWRDDWRYKRSVEQDREHRKQMRKRRDRRYFGENLVVPHDATLSDYWRKRFDLPVFDSEHTLANWLDMPLSRLRWFTYNRPAETVWHYRRYEIPKRSGGKRVIIAPKAELKALQRYLLDNLLSHMPQWESSHGFVPGRSIVTNAEPHIGKKFILKMDLKDFFPSIHVRRVQGFWAGIYPSAVATALALLMTACDRIETQHQGETRYISTGERHLVQGAPTSPAMANILAYNVDYRLSGIADTKDVAYTRYADDLTLSSDDEDSLLRVMDVANRIIADEGFVVNEDKTRIMRQSTRQVIAGVVVNEKLSTPREVRRTLRAILHKAQYTGLDAQNRDNHPHFRAYVRGMIAYIHAVNPEQAAPLYKQLEAVPD